MGFTTADKIKGPAVSVSEIEGILSKMASKQLSDVFRHLRDVLLQHGVYISRIREVVVNPSELRIRLYTDNLRIDMTPTEGGWVVSVTEL